MDIHTTVSDAVELLKRAEAKYDAGNKDAWRALRADARTALTEAGLQRIGSGDYRVVYRLPNDDRVLKVAKNPLGTTENLAAADNWQQAVRLQVDEHLAELHEHDPDGWWLLQERVSQTAPPSVQPLKHTLRDAGVSIDEITIHNVGQRTDGSFVLFDYGGS